jgi:hypothetical protein
MILNKIFLFGSILTVLTGCGFFSNKVEKIVEKEELKNYPVVKPAKKDLFCHEKSTQQILIEDEPTQKFYKPILSSLIENKNYSFTERAAMFSFIEMLRRPDAASPTSRFQFFLRLKGKDYYYDFYPDTKNGKASMPYMKGIEFLIKNLDGHSDFQKIVDRLETNVPSTFNVSSELEIFLQNHRKSISLNDELTEYFFKGDEILTKHESFKRLSFKKIYQQYKMLKYNSDSLYMPNEFQLRDVYTGTSDLKLNCNLDINKENISNEDIVQSKISKNSHYFALMDGNNFFIATTSSVIPEKLENIKGTYFFKLISPSVPLPICEYKTQSQDTILFSTKGRLPSQHLRHLVTYDIGLADSQETIQELLTFSRHLFLSNPDRILYESKRGRKSQLDFFLSMNFPIYHVSVLGDIMGASIFNNKTESSKSLLIDDRSNSRLKCAP